jgi:hypothetical protein
MDLPLFDTVAAFLDARFDDDPGRDRTSRGALQPDRCSPQREENLDHNVLN